MNKIVNFDNLAQSLLALFVMSTANGWESIMNHGIDAVGIDMNP